MTAKQTYYLLIFLTIFSVITSYSPINYHSPSNITTVHNAIKSQSSSVSLFDIFTERREQSRVRLKSRDIKYEDKKSDQQNYKNEILKENTLITKVYHGQVNPESGSCNEIDCYNSEDKHRNCSEGEFYCDNECYPLTVRCDGWRHCLDNSDEDNCRNDRDCDARHEFQCADGACIDAKQRCDGNFNCADSSDEITCHCQDNQFRCRTLFECVDSKKRCDRRYDCRDGSDEFRCEENRCAVGQFRCQTGQCIAERTKCNGFPDCADGSDENGCVTEECDETNREMFRCQQSRECITRKYVCDQRYDCNDGSDEQQNCTDSSMQNNVTGNNKTNKDQRMHESFNNNEQCKHPDMFSCRDGQCVSASARCDFVKQCNDGSDEMDCQIICGVHEFECLLDRKCIDESLRCDGYYDCYDFSDESNCENRTCRLSQYRCSTGLCVDRALLCNGQPDCPDRSDENECWLCRYGQFHCANGECVSMSSRCNGIYDCSDGSDESDCRRTEIQLQIYPEKQTVQQGGEAVFRCRDEGNLRIPVRWTMVDGAAGNIQNQDSEQERELPPGAIDLHGRLTLIGLQVNMSGVYVCTVAKENQEQFRARKAAHLIVRPNVDYEIMINHSPQNDHSDSMTVNSEAGITSDPENEIHPQQNEMLNASPSLYCRKVEAACANGDCILREYVCDSVFDCADHSDEQNCEPHCEPHQFKCNNGKCISKIFRCDSDDNCGDHSDENNCEPETSLNSTCKMYEYECKSGNQCIPRSFHCNEKFDCQDRSDEVGCSQPTIVQEPGPLMIVTEGQSVTLKCRAIGVPEPIIVWRLNGGHIPRAPHVTTSSIKGQGILIIQEALLVDQGSYSCEAINIHQSIKAQQNSLLVVKQRNNVCQPPYFNDLARDMSECVRCFCFGVTSTCYSSSLERFAINLDEDERLSIVILEPQKNGTYVDISSRNLPNESSVKYDSISRSHTINSEVAALQTPKEVYFYWKLPSRFLSNQLLSYGSSLRYKVHYQRAYSSSPLNIPDVILKGANGIVLYHFAKYDHHRSDEKSSQIELEMNARFIVDEWHRDEHSANSDFPPLFEEITREDILILMQNVEEILIKASYDANLLNSSIQNIVLESAKISNQTDQIISSIIEHCTCPEGYRGSSCEECAPNYVRSAAGARLGRCNLAPIVCNCNGYSDECDRFTGQCLNCQNFTDGEHCELCQKGYYRRSDIGIDGRVSCTPCPCGQNSIDIKSFELDNDDDDIDRNDDASSDLDDEHRIPEKWLRISCHYDQNNSDVVCDSCPTGYEGDHCDHCARGFSRRLIDNDEMICELKEKCRENQFRCGNGTCIDKSSRCNNKLDCTPDGNDEFGCENIFGCNPLGSRSLRPNAMTGVCDCKSLVSGDHCDQCKLGSFYLNGDEPNGCFECFCFGITTSCTAAFNLYRDYIELKLDQYATRSITLRDRHSRIEPIKYEQLKFDHINNELLYKQHFLSSDLFWQLPSQFLGNKITSFGGNLSYTFRFEGIISTEQEFDKETPLAILTGRNMTIVYHHSVESLLPIVANIISISLRENVWQFQDGKPTSRRDLLTVLSHLDSLLLRATFGPQVHLVALNAVHLHTTIHQQNSHSSERVETVEECRCPSGYTGMSCEKCAPGYRVSSMSRLLDRIGFDSPHERLFSCEPCFCNGHSNSCDSETGICVNCQHSTTGKQCEECMDKFEGNALLGTPYDCIPTRSSSINESLIQLESTKSESELKGVHCLETTSGKHCSECNEGYFKSDTQIPPSCLSCWCSGLAVNCISAPFFWSSIDFVLTKIYPPQSHNFELTNRFRTKFYSEKIFVNLNNNELFFNSNFWLQDVHAGKTVEGEFETLYWSLPEKFLGNRITSYGGQIRYKQRYSVETIGEFIADIDLFLHGNGIMLQFINSEPFSEDEEVSHAITISAEDGTWQKVDHRTRRITVATRNDFMKVLTRLEMIAIRATLHTQMKESIIKDVSIDEAVASAKNTFTESAMSIEKCHCPIGYMGLSCEQCSPGYILQHRGDNGLSPVCVKCSCNNHASECSSDGSCLNCQDHTVGNYCEKCEQGYYGDATKGNENDCKPCSCPLIIPGNNFSPTCHLAQDGQPICDDCSNGYHGRFCEQCQSGFRGNPNTPGGKCKSFRNGNGNQTNNGKSTIKVKIEGKPVRNVPVGSTITLKCVSHSSHSYAFNLDWIKLEGQLPVRASEASGVLSISNAQIEDSGIYVCTGSDLKSVARAQVTVYVQLTQRHSPPKVRIEPKFQEVYSGDSVNFRCISDANPTPNLLWTIGQNRRMNPSSRFDSTTGIFTIPAAKLSDEAEYYCQATNSVGSESARTVLFVRKASPSENNHEYFHPDGEVLKAKVLPSNQVTVQRGESVRFECSVTGQPVPTIRWTFTGAPDGQRLPANAREKDANLLLSRVDLEDAGVYTCIASNSFGTAEAQVRLRVDFRQNQSPTVQVEPVKQTIAQGENGEMRCLASGDPRPRIFWQKLGDSNSDSSRHRTIDDRLVIERAEVSDRGMYVCRAENSIGSAQASAMLEVEQREIPEVEIRSDSFLIVNRGKSAYFHCRIVGGIPKPSVEWRRADGSSFSSNVKVIDGLLQFKKVTAHDEGNYICTAENIAGRMTVHAKLKIADSPRIQILQNSPYRTRPGEHVRLECQLLSYEFNIEAKPHLTWHRVKLMNSAMKNGTIQYTLPTHPVSVFEDRAIMEISDIKPSDGGHYVCSASSANGNTEDRIEIIVEEQNGQILPNVYIEDKVVTVAAGSRAELRCFVRGTRRPVKIKWTRIDNQPLPDSAQIENGTLTIEKVKPQDGGDYQCLGYVDAGNENNSKQPVEAKLLFRDRAKLAVVVPPKISLNPPVQTARPGDTVLFDCVAADLDDRTMVVDWSRIGYGDDLPTGVIVVSGDGGARLRISFISEADAGRYLCTAVNAAGKTEAAAELIVDRSIKEPMNDNVTEVVTIAGSNIDLKCPELFQQAQQYEIVWKFEQQDRLPTNVQLLRGELRLFQVNGNHSGKYYCSLRDSNRIIAQSTILLKVKIRTDIDVKIEPSSELINFGDTLVLKCNVHGDDSPQIHWEFPYESSSWKDNVKEDIGNRHILTIRNVTYENGGVYRCVVKTYAGIFNADYVLVLQESQSNLPKIPRLSVLVVITKQGAIEYLPCNNITGLNEPIQYSWRQAQTFSDHSTGFTDSLYKMSEQILPDNVLFFSNNGTLQITNVTLANSGTYICTARSENSSIESGTLLLIESSIARFVQQPISYIVMSTLRNGYKTFDLKLSIKPESPEGLILYNGNSLDKDFIALGLFDGFVQFRINLGDGIIELQSSEAIALNHWHTIHVSRDNKIINLTVDDNETKFGKSKGFRGLDLIDPLYLGNVPPSIVDQQIHGFRSGFSGCLSLVKFNEKIINPIQDAIRRLNVDRCETCWNSPCQNDAICREDSQSLRGFTCNCLAGYFGEDCEKVFTQPTETSTIAFNNLPKTVISIDETFTEFITEMPKKNINCGFGTFGLNCEQNILITVPSFDSNSYLSYKVPTGILEKLDIQLRIRPNIDEEENHLGRGRQLLLYSAQYANGTGDFISFEIDNKNMQIIFRFDTGSGPTELKSNFSNSEWILIIMERFQRKAKLTINNNNSVSGEAPGKNTYGLTFNTNIFIGGYKKKDIQLAKPLKGISNFSGCISELIINQKNINFAQDFIESANIFECENQENIQNIKNKCSIDRCKNNGVCVQNETSSFCICSEGFTGENCELLNDPCNEIDNLCSSRGECEQNDEEHYTCHCSIGFQGNFCESIDEKLRISPLSIVKMSGDSILSFDNSFVTQSSSSKKEHIYHLEIQTNQTNARLIYFGSDMKSKDFFSANIEDGFIKMHWELGSGIGHAFSNITINDNHVHHIMFFLKDRSGKIFINQTLVGIGDSPGRHSMLNSRSDIFIGGIFKNIQHLNPFPDLPGFKGNIRVGLGSQFVDWLDLLLSTKRSRNIQSVDSLNFNSTNKKNQNSIDLRQYLWSFTTPLATNGNDSKTTISDYGSEDVYNYDDNDNDNADEDNENDDIDEHIDDDLLNDDYEKKPNQN